MRVDDIYCVLFLPLQVLGQSGHSPWNERIPGGVSVLCDANSGIAWVY